MKTEILNIDEIHEAIIAFARGEFDKRLTISKNLDIRDSVVAGINMLGEELEAKTISRDYFLNIFHAVSEILIVTDLNGKILNANQSASFYLEVELEDFQNKLITPFFDANHVDFKQLLVEIDSCKSQYFEFETDLISSKNDHFPVNGTISKIHDNLKKHMGYLLTMKDITELKQKQKDILKAVITTEEKERKRIAYDLHDSLGQELSAIKVYMNNLNPLDDNFAFQLQQCQQMIDHSIQNIQELSFNLMPKALEAGNLIWALKELKKRMPKTVIFSLSYNKDQLQLSKNTQLIVYRVLQEFISNSLKHAKATKLKVEVNAAPNLTSINILDNGKGFDLSKLERVNGVNHMKTRLDALNVKYELTSKLKHGTQLNLQISHENN